MSYATLRARCDALALRLGLTLPGDAWAAREAMWARRVALGDENGRTADPRTGATDPDTFARWDAAGHVFDALRGLTLPSDGSPAAQAWILCAVERAEEILAAAS